MRFFSSFRLLMLAIWLGASVYFIGVAQSAFAVLPERELAGAVVNRTLSILNYGGMVISVLLILTSFVGTSAISRFSVWIERFLLLVIAAGCAVGQLVIGTWLASLRSQMGGPVDSLAADDPLRMQFNTVHAYSEWVLMTAMVAALIAFLMIANRRFMPAVAAPSKDEPYDFSREFKV